jgi:acyl-CoA synthetase (AMP-forming)/AMP-acid ligase II
VEVPVAFLVLRAGVPVTEAELDAYCRERLANFKVPTRFIFKDALIRTTATMRIQKAALRDLLKAETHG